jgi:hypothetical protein
LLYGSVVQHVFQQLQAKNIFAGLNYSKAIKEDKKDLRHS